MGPKGPNGLKNGGRGWNPESLPIEDRGGPRSFLSAKVPAYKASTVHRTAVRRARMPTQVSSLPTSSLLPGRLGDKLLPADSGR